MQELCKIGQTFLDILLHEMLPYPLLEMCRKYQENVMLWKAKYAGNFIFGTV